ncbi:MAG: PKD domain-containing protein [Proteobacteria bacterium]|nr:PKD domain-containing protein [Pseudomonadota bacterium]
MSILKIIAIVIVIGSLVTFVIQFVKGKSRSSWLFAATAVLSIVLFVMADKVEKMKQGAQEVPQQVADGEVSPQVADGEVPEAKEEVPSAETNNFDFADNDDDEPSAGEAAAEAPAEAAAEAPAEAAAEAPAEAAAEAPAEAAAEAPAEAAAEAPAEAAAEAPAEAAAEAPAEAAAEAPAEAAAEAPAEAAAEAPAEAAAEAPAEAAAEAPAEAAAEAPAEAAAEAPAEAAVEAHAEAVENDPLAPKAVAGAPIDDAKIKEVIVFDASQSKKNKASIKKYHWDFGDGATADTAKATHGYAEVGSYTATLTIEDADGHKATDTRKIDVTRPEAKIRYTQSVKKIADVVSSTSAPADVTGTATKLYPASNMTLEAKGTLESSDGCTCSLAVVLTGPGCNGMQTKKVSDGGEGSLSVKTTCRSQAGEYTWTVKRTSSGSCACSWTDIKIDGYEN